MIVWYRYEIVPFCFSLYKLGITVLLHSTQFFQNFIIHQLEKIFFEISSTFFSAVCSCQCMVLAKRFDI